LAGEVALKKGSLLLNGRAATDYVLADRQSRIKLLSNENTLIEGTLLENMTAFQPKIFRDRAIGLAQRLGVEETISQGAEGFGMFVGPDSKAGLPKSLADVITIIGGLVGAPDVVLFDEANGALDRDSDAKLLKYLKATSADRAMIIVSNRPSYLKLATSTFDITDFAFDTALGKAAA
jgi:ATP-binding cassette subfamily C protein LapB